METVLIAGVETLFGANLAASLSGHQRVIGVAFQDDAAAGVHCSTTQPDAIRRELAMHHIDRVVYCGPGAESGWRDAVPTETDVARLEGWLAALDGQPAPFTYLSSDAIFTGPWMFHAENSASYCDSPAAKLLRRMEAAVTERRPDALLVRTHLFGWTPQKNGWVEHILTQLETQQTPTLDCVRHASPLLASDLVAVLLRAWQTGLTGTYHIAGAERVNPVLFARRLAHQFDKPFATIVGSESLSDRASGFGRGETSLQTRKIRRALGIGLPLLSEGLERLYQQHLDGERKRIQSASTPPEKRAA